MRPPTVIVSPQAASSSAGCDPVAAQIGAVNTLIRQQQQPAAGSSDGGSSGSSSSSKTSWRGYNTDWLAAISAIERVLAAGSSDAAAVTSSSGSNGSSGSSESVLKGKTVCVVGAGGAGRALAFGAASKGAKVIIANRCVCVVVRWCFKGVSTVVLVSTVWPGLLKVMLPGLHPDKMPSQGVHSKCS
jgi:3-dehydroquinate dehydratase/shikimate dehydrogenase